MQKSVLSSSPVLRRLLVGEREARARLARRRRLTVYRVLRAGREGAVGIAARSPGARARYPSIFPGGPPKDAISEEKLMPASVGMLSASDVALHSPISAAYVSVPMPAPHPISIPLE